MFFLQNFEFERPKLLIFCVGGNMEKSNIEIHDVLFLVAKTDREATEKVKHAWWGTAKSLHVDSWFAIENVDGFDIGLQQTKPQKKSNQHLYFVNLGYYQEGVFGEGHFMTCVVADSKIEAVEKAKQLCQGKFEMLHNDNVYDLDDCLQISEVDRHFITLQYSGVKSPSQKPINGYQKLRSLAQTGAIA